MPSKKEVDELLKMFHDIDRNKDGYISRTELFTKVGTKSLDRQKVHELIKLFDINGDGLISFGEYKLILGLTGQSIDGWKRLFRKLDKDGSVVDSYNEFFVAQEMTIYASFIHQQDVNLKRIKSSRLMLFIVVI
ncbi:unnamed protein product [Schistosoma haematobium]|nr:unnamed protein product [Schistosoma haematobium]CAH8675563.1 unnamed protein product [Schistosoma haematobium]